MALLLNVHIWGWRGLGVEWGRVGHVMIANPSSNVSLLSQFPHGLGQPSVPKGPNICLSFTDTYKAEDDSMPDAIFEISIQDQFLVAFQAMRENHLARPIWDWDPTAPTQTHCARSAYDSLRAGGIAIDPDGAWVIADGETCEILPNTLWYLLEQVGAKVVRMTQQNLKFETLRQNELAVSLARREKLWE